MERLYQYEETRISSEYFCSTIINLNQFTHHIVKTSKKWLFALLTLWIGSILIFVISNSIPQDIVDVQLANININQENVNYKKEYEKIYLKENKHLPIFYFSILPHHYHSNINSIVDKLQRNKVQQEQKFSSTPFHFPKLVWHGFENQYHIYLSNALRGDFGRSKKDGLPVGNKIKTSLYWTASILLMSLLISIVISFILAYLLVTNENKWWTKAYGGFALFLFSMPGFWLATIVLVFFTGPQYGMPIFYSPLYLETGDSFLSIFAQGFSKMLPVIFCMCLLDIAYLSILLKDNIKAELAKPYITALKSRGISFKDILKRHAYPNVMVPFVTLVVGSIPIALAGSLVLEIIFNIPGMGRLLYDSIYTADWKVVYAIVLLILLVTVILYKVGDQINQSLDPRIGNT